MKNNRLSLLNPKAAEIENYVKEHEEKWEFSDKLIYIGCVKKIEDVELCETQEKDVNGPIRTFLHNWGMMGRVLGGLERSWESRLATMLRKLSHTLNGFRKSELKNADISKLKNDIKKCYEELQGIVKPVAASKVLHLICPEFFPLWDTDIREQVSKERRNNGEAGIGVSAAGYYNFIREIRKFLKNEKYYRIISELSKRYEKPKLRIIDEFMWEATR